MRPSCRLSARFAGCLLLAMVVACNTTPQIVLDDFSGAELAAPEGIDPKNPNIERSTDSIDFDGIETIRIDIPTGRVQLSQSLAGSTATVQITEIITRGGIDHGKLADYLFQSGVSFERSFVDGTRLDVEAAVAEGLADQDILFDVRVMVPGGAHVEILVGRGPVKVDGLVGNVEIRTSDGTIDINAVEGNVIAQTTMKPINLFEVSGDVKAITTEEDVTLRLAPAAAGRVSAQTTSGSINMMVSKSATASLSLTSMEGVVTADLNGFDVSDVSTGAGFFEGVLNGGGGAIEAKSLTGEILFAGM